MKDCYIRGSIIVEMLSRCLIIANSEGVRDGDYLPTLYGLLAQYLGLWV